MDCHVISTARQTLFASNIFSNISCLSRNTRRLQNESTCALRIQCNMGACSLRLVSQSLSFLSQEFDWKRHLRDWRAHCAPFSLEEEFSSLQSGEHSNDHEDADDASLEEDATPVTSDELKALLVDSERARLVKKLSEANQHNRFLKRQLNAREEALISFNSELAVMEQEIQALVALAVEIINSGIPEGSRKINGKYIQSHLLSRLEAVHEKLKEQIKDVDAAQSVEVPLFWYGVAESVQVMGSFDGWSQGEHLSPEYTGSYAKFSTKLMLRPGRYEIKFLVDGEWQLSPEFPTVGDGLMKNNLLVVE